MDMLFVCLGNICRSPLAQGIAQDYISRFNLKAKVDSAGISGWHDGEAPCNGSILVAKKHGIDISNFKSRKINLQKDNAFNIIIAMDQSNLADLIEIGFDPCKIHKLGDFGLNSANIPDPYYYKSNEGFERVYTMIETGVKNIFYKYFGVC